MRIADVDGVTLEIRLGLGYTPGSADSFDILTSGSPAVTSFKAGGFANEVDGRVSFDFGSFAVVHGEGFIRIEDFALVPEPSAWAGAAGLGLLGFAGWRRSRCTRAS